MDQAGIKVYPDRLLGFFQFFSRVWGQKHKSDLTIYKTPFVKKLNEVNFVKLGGK
jgi:hypothetical protein